MNKCICGCNQTTNKTWATGCDSKHFWKLIGELVGDKDKTEKMIPLLEELVKIKGMTDNLTTT